jgi:hypothetical protein
MQLEHDCPFCNRTDNGGVSLDCGYLLLRNFYLLTTIGYRGALLSSLLQVNVYVTHNLLNVLVQIAK